MKKTAYIGLAALLALTITSVSVIMAATALSTASFAAGEAAAENEDSGTAGETASLLEIRSALLDYIYYYEYSVSLSNRLELAQSLYDDAYHRFQKDEKNEDELDSLGKSVEDLSFEIENNGLELQKVEIKLRQLTGEVADIEEAEAILTALPADELDIDGLIDAAYDKAVDEASAAKLKELTEQRDAEKSAAEAEAMKNKLESLAAQTVAETTSAASSDENNAVGTYDEITTEAAMTTAPQTTSETETHNGELWCDCPICRAARETMTEAPSFKPFEPFYTETTKAETATAGTESDTTAPEPVETVSETETSAETTIKAPVETTVSATEAETASSEPETVEPEIVVDPESLDISREKLSSDVAMKVVELKISYNNLVKTIAGYNDASAGSETAYSDYKKGLISKTEYYSAIDLRYTLRSEVYKALCEYSGLIFELDDLAPDTLELTGADITISTEIK